MIHPTLKIRPEALRAARQRLQAAAGRIHQHRVTVGLHEDHADDGKRNYVGAETKAKLVTVAAVMEFGGGAVKTGSEKRDAKGRFLPGSGAKSVMTIPARSWLRDWFDQHRGDLERRMVDTMRKELKEYETGAEASQAIIEFAQASLDEMGQRISAGIMPPLAPATEQARRRAGLDTDPALVATGQFKKALTAHVDGRVTVLGKDGL